MVVYAQAVIERFEEGNEEKFGADKQLQSLNRAMLNRLIRDTAIQLKEMKPARFTSPN
jgi:hypothetical protein